MFGAMRKFTTTDKPAAKPVPFDLDGRVMEFTPPGWAPVLDAAENFTSEDPLGSLRTLLDWLGAGLSEDDGTHILDRLSDPNDPFDIDDAMMVVLGILEEVAARPTQPSSESSPSPEEPSSTAGRHLAESTLSTSP